MTVGELERSFMATKKREEVKRQEKAYFDYTLANLICISIGRLYSKSNKMPPIEEVYPNIFDSKDIEEEKQKLADEKSALNFMHFAQAFNAKYKEVKNK